MKFRATLWCDFCRIFVAANFILYFYAHISMVLSSLTMVSTVSSDFFKGYFLFKRTYMYIRYQKWRVMRKRKSKSKTKGDMSIDKAITRTQTRRNMTHIVHIKLKKQTYKYEQCGPYKKNWDEFGWSGRVKG